VYCRVGWGTYYGAALLLEGAWVMKDKSSAHFTNKTLVTRAEADIGRMMIAF